MMLNTPFSVRSCLAAGLVLVLGGCAALGVDNRPADQIVAERAQAWADALLVDDHEVAYEYTNPGYRQFASPDKYHARVAGTSRWESAEVREVTCEESACTVRMVVGYRGYKNTVDVVRSREYRWVLSEGRWWLYVAAR